MWKTSHHLSFAVLLAYTALCSRADAQQSLQPVEAPKPLVSETYLGVFTDPLPKSLAFKKSLDLLQEQKGLLVTNVLPDSPAAKAGLKQNDILLKYDKQVLKSPQQLKTLIVHDSVDRPVNLHVVRGEEILEAEVSLAERLVTGASAAAGFQEIRFPQVVRLVNRGGTSVLVTYDGLTIPGTEVLWRVRQTPAPTESPVRAKSETQNQWIAISLSEGAQCRLEVSRTDENGKSSGHQWEGTPQEIQVQIQEAPAEITAEVSDSLDWAQTQAKRTRTTRMRFQPRIEGSKRGMRLLMCLPEKEGSLRCLQVDHYFKSGEPVEAEALLDLEPFIRELKRLSPIVREKVESELRSVTIPEIKISIERSQ